MQHVWELVPGERPRLRRQEPVDRLLAGRVCLSSGPGRDRTLADQLNRLRYHGNPADVAATLLGRDVRGTRASGEQLQSRRLDPPA